MNARILSLLLLVAGASAALEAAEPKRILLVTTTIGFRHSSIEIGEKVLRELAAKTGEFVIVSTAEHPDYPSYSAGRGGRGGVQVPGLSAAQQAAMAAYTEAVTPATQRLTEARQALLQAALSDRNSVPARATAVGDAERALALARADALAQMQQSPGRLTRDQTLMLAGLVQPPTEAEQVRRVLATYMNPQTLRTFDGIYFNSTVGQLPFPDMDDFFRWVSEGGSVMGNHAASDSMHGTPEYAAMLGGEFQRHGQQATGRMVNFDPAHPATRTWGESREVFDELYMFWANYDRSKVHSLISMVERPDDGLGVAGEPGWFPVAWTKMYGQGRVFFTSFGHREDVWDPNWTDGSGQRRNPPEVAEAFQAHLLGGIRWALGLAEGDVIPQFTASE
jgi:type 1 glutamine amidotransferase